MLKVTVLYKGQTYDIFGVEAIDSMAKNNKGLFFYFQDRMDGMYTRTLSPAKIVAVRTCELGNEHNPYETKRALGWL